MSIYEYVYFGTTFLYLREVDPGEDIHGHGFVLDNLSLFLDRLEEFRLTVTTQAADWDLIDIRDELEATDSDDKLSKDQAARLASAMSRIRLTLDAETQLTSAFVVEDKRIDVKKLLEDVPSLLPPAVWPRLPSLARYDIEQGARCIAFELPTAAAFHVLRATEEVLRSFYRCVIKQKRLRDPMWGPMVDQMRKKKTNRPDNALLDVLDRIRVNFRNPTQHPDATYDIHEAQDVFLACLEACGRMTQSPQWD